MPESSDDPKFFGLPHAEPFVFVDAVEVAGDGNYARCRVAFGMEREFFRGHFPGRAIVPGVILTEALAQTAGIAAGGSDAEGRRSFLLSAIRSMKFKRAVLPDERVILEATKRGEMAGLLQFDTVASIGDEVVADGQIILSEATF